MGTLGVAPPTVSWLGYLALFGPMLTVFGLAIIKWPDSWDWTVPYIFGTWVLVGLFVLISVWFGWFSATPQTGLPAIIGTVLSAFAMAFSRDLLD